MAGLSPKWALRAFTNRKLYTAASVSLSALFLYVAFRFLSWERLLVTLQQFDWRWLIPSSALVIIWYGVRALRWQAILKTAGAVPLRFLFEALVLGFFTNMVLPINVGEVVRAYLVKRNYGLSMFTLFGSYAVERVFGLVAFWLVALVAVLGVSLPTEVAQIRQQLLLSLGLGLIALVALLLLVLWVRTSDPRLGRAGRVLTTRLPAHWQTRMAGGWQHFRQGLRLGGTRRDTIVILLYSLALRLLSGLIMWCLAQSFGISLSLLAYLFVDVIVTVAHVAGSHFLGIVGTFEASLTYTLNLFGAAREAGLSIALLIRVVFAAPLIVLGSIFFFKQGLTWAELQTLRTQVSPQGTDQRELSKEVMQDAQR